MDRWRFLLPLAATPLLLLPWRQDLAGLCAALLGALLLAAAMAGRAGRATVASGAALLLAGWTICFLDPKVEWDGAGYYAQARSLAFDGDLDLSNDMALMPTLEPLARRTPIGRWGLPFPVGPALTWLPWMGALRAAGAGPTGLEYPYLLGVGLTGILLGALGLWWLARAPSADGDPPSAREQSVRIAVAFASMAPLYWVFQPAYSQALQFAASCGAMALMLRLHARWRSGGLTAQGPFVAPGAALGLACGAMFLARWQHGLLALALAGPFLMLFRDSARAERMGPLFRGVLAFAAACVLCLVPQSLVLHATWGTWLELPRMEEGFFDLTRPQVAGVLFSSWNGLFTSHPALAAGVAGAVLLAWRRPELRPLLAGVVLWMAAEVWVVSAVADWHGGGAFGQRRLTAIVPWLAWLAGAALETTGRERLRALAAGALALLVAANFVHGGAFAHYRVPPSPADPSNYIHTKRRTPWHPFEYGPMLGDRARGAAWFVRRAASGPQADD